MVAVNIKQEKVKTSTDTLKGASRTTVAKSRTSGGPGLKTPTGKFKTGAQALGAKFDAVLKKAQSIGARQGAKGGQSSTDRLAGAGRPSKAPGALKSNIAGALKQLGAKRAVKSATGVRNEGRPVKNTRATKPSDRLKALDAGVRTSNKAFKANVSAGKVPKLSSPSTGAKSATDKLRAKPTKGRTPVSLPQQVTNMKARRAKAARKVSGTSTDKLKSSGSITGVDQLAKTRTKKKAAKAKTARASVGRVIGGRAGGTIGPRFMKRDF